MHARAHAHKIKYRKTYDMIACDIHIRRVKKPNEFMATGYLQYARNDQFIFVRHEKTVE